MLRVTAYHSDSFKELSTWPHPHSHSSRLFFKIITSTLSVVLWSVWCGAELQSDEVDDAPRVMLVSEGVMRPK